MKSIAALAFFIFTSSTVFAANIEYLEEKTAYCHSQQSLSQYLDMAKMRNIEGLNQLVLDGKCDFVPDGQVISLGKYRKDAIGSTPIVTFNRNEETLWTFSALVQTTEIGSL